MPTTYANKGNLVGMSYAQAWLVGPDNKAYGTLGYEAAIAAAATASPMMHSHLMEFPVSAAVPNPQRVYTQLRGGNRNLGQIAWGISDLGQFPLVLSNMDALFHALASNGAVDTTTNKRWLQYGSNKNLERLPAMGLLLTAILQSRDEGSDGAELYVHYVIPRCTVDAQFGQMQFQAATDMTYTVAPSFANTTLNGVPFSATGMNLKGNKDVMYCIVSPHPLALTSSIGDGTTDTFELGFLPRSNSIALPSATDGTPNEIRVGATATAPASVSVSTAEVEMSAPPAENVYWSALYETDYEEVA